VGPTCRREKKRKEKEGKADRGVRAEAGWAAARSWAPGAAQLGCAPLIFVLIHFPFSVFIFLL
jgi:hypothetical protein